METILLAGDFKGEFPADSRPTDPFVAFGQSTFLGEILQWLAQTGVERVIVASEAPLPRLRQDYPELTAFGMELVECVSEPGAGTGGTLRRAASRALRSDEFLVLRADRFLPVDPHLIQRRRARAGLDLAMALVTAPAGSDRSRIQLDDAWRVVELHEAESVWIDAGMYAMTRHALLASAEQAGFDFASEGLSALKGRIAGLVFSGPIADLRLPSTLGKRPNGAPENGGPASIGHRGPAA
ncbi:MAG: NTP transferase domain-containing protein [Planctomycetota bacterium]